MSTTSTPVHVPVDEMLVHNGPSEEELLTLPRWDRWGLEQASVKLTLSTPASRQTFVRKTTITKVERQYEDIGDFMSRLRTTEQYFDGPKPTGKLLIQGRIGDWRFSGVYDPHTRTGTLTERKYDPELEEQLSIESSLTEASMIDLELRNQR